MRNDHQIPPSKQPLLRSFLKKLQAYCGELRNSQRGMTLVEVMVSLTLTALIVGVVGVMMSQSDRQFRFISQQSMIEREYRELTDFLSTLFRRQAISGLEVPQNTGEGNPNESILLSWKGNDPAVSGMLVLFEQKLIWRQVKKADGGNLPEESNLALADELKDIRFTWDPDSGKIQAEMTWEMSSGQTVVRSWQMHISRLDQPVLPTPSFEPLPEATDS